MKCLTFCEIFLFCYLFGYNFGRGGVGGCLKAHAQLAVWGMGGGVFYFIDKVAFAGDLSVQFRKCNNKYL
jgi:hypothetical protein